MWVSKETTSGPRKKTFEFLATSFGLRFGFMASSSSSRALVEFLIFQGTQVRPRISAPLERPPVHRAERGSTGIFSGAARTVIVPDPGPHLVLLRSLRSRETSSYERHRDGVCEHHRHVETYRAVHLQCTAAWHWLWLPWACVLGRSW